MITLVDSMNMIFMAYHMARKQLHDSGEILTDENIGFFAHMFFNKVNSILTTYDNVVFCWEGENSLGHRRKLFPDYKGNRKAQKGEDEHKTLMRFIPKLQEALSNYPIKHVKVDGGEADDAIYAICAAEAPKGEEITILSSDKDLSQISLTWPNVTVYNPIFKRVLKPSENIIMEKAICGDPSDNVPGLYRVGPKTLEKMLADKSEWKKIMARGNNKALYDTFRKIVDLSLFPKDYHERCVEFFQNLPDPDFKPDNLELFFWDYKMKDMLDRWQNIKSEIYLKIGKKQVDEQIQNLGQKDDSDLPQDEEADELDKIIADFV